MDVKLCNKCWETKPITEFYKNGARWYYSHCKPCKNEAIKKYEEKHKEKLTLMRKNWSRTHREQRTEANKKWRENNPEKWQAYMKEKRALYKSDGRKAKWAKKTHRKWFDIWDIVFYKDIRHKIRWVKNWVWYLVMEFWTLKESIIPRKCLVTKSKYLASSAINRWEVI